MTHSLFHQAVLLCSEVIHGSCSGAERLAGSTAPSVRSRWAAPLAIQSPTARKGDQQVTYYYILAAHFRYFHFPGKFAQLPALIKALINFFILDNSNFSIPNLNHLTFKKCRNNFHLTGILNLTYLTIVSIMFKKYNVHVFFDNITNEYVQHFGRLNFTFWARLCRHFLLEEVFHIFIIH